MHRTEISSWAKSLRKRTASGANSSRANLSAAMRGPSVARGASHAEVFFAGDGGLAPGGQALVGGEVASVAKGGVPWQGA